MLYWLTRAAQRLAGWLPRRVRWWLGGVVTLAVYWLWAAKRLATQHNMSVVLGLPLADPRVQRAARLSWYNYGRVVADYFDFANHSPTAYIRMCNNVTYSAQAALAMVDEARSYGRGVIVPTGHFGSWDVAGIVLASHHPLNVLAESLHDERMDHLFQEQRRAFGMNVILIDNAIRPLMRLLKQGEMIATPMDRPLPAGEGVPIQFFGRTTYVPRGLGALAVKMGAVIMPGFAWYNDHGGYNTRSFTPVLIERSGDEDADIIRATQVMFDALEAIIRLDPTQWYMFRPFWPDDTAPLGNDAHRDAAPANITVVRANHE